MKITDKLEELGFEYKKYNGEMALVFSVDRGKNQRFPHDFVYYEDENRFYINCFKLSGWQTVSEEEVITNINNTRILAKEKWLEIKESLKGFGFKID